MEAGGWAGLIADPRQRKAVIFPKWAQRMLEHGAVQRALETKDLRRPPEVAYGRARRFSMQRRNATAYHANQRARAASRGARRNVQLCAYR
jgi:hypothetical protein